MSSNRTGWLGHRARLTLVSAGSACLLYLLLTVISLIALRRSEEATALNALRPAIRQIRNDLVGGEAPDLEEVVLSNRDVSLAVYDLHGKLLYHDGTVIPPLTSTPEIEDQWVVRSAVAGKFVVTGAVPWSAHARLIRRFELLCALAWIPLVGFVAAATWLAARATFLPLEAISRQAESMSASDLSARLRVDDRGEYREFAVRLNRFLERLEGSVRREERFLSDAAHELRTPLTVLRGQIEASLLSPRSESEYRATLNLLRDEVERLSRLTELLLRSAAPRTGPEPCVDVSVVAEKSHARWVDRFAGKHVRLDLTAEPALACITEPELTVVLDNLLANAFKFGPQNGACSIELSASEGRVRLAVEDDGPGVPSGASETIFERFATGDESESSFGIGLALCRRIIEERKGTLQLEPSEAGSRFVVDLPQCQ